MEVPSERPMYAPQKVDQMAMHPAWDHFFSSFPDSFGPKEKRMVINNIVEFTSRQINTMLQNHIRKIKEIHRKERENG